jgi:hypothetical protein
VLGVLYASPCDGDSPCDGGFWYSWLFSFVVPPGFSFGSLGLCAFLVLLLCPIHRFVLIIGRCPRQHLCDPPSINNSFTIFLSLRSTRRACKAWNIPLILSLYRWTPENEYSTQETSLQWLLLL